MQIQKTGAVVRMSDVATEAGVSLSTVSKVINGRDGISRLTADRVWSAVRRLDFEASLGARSLHGGPTKVLGVLARAIHDIDSALLSGISSAVAPTAYDLLVFAGHGHRESTGWEMRTLRRLGSLIDAALILEPTGPIGQVDLPLIVVEPRHDYHLPTSNINDAQIGTLVAEHLLRAGHRHVAVAVDPAEGERTQQREHGFIDTMSAAHATVRQIRTGSDRGTTSMRRLLNETDTPTAIFAVTELVEGAVVAAVTACGVRVPEDVAVIGAGDQSSLFTQAALPVKLPSPHYAVGAWSARALIDLLEV